MNKLTEKSLGWTRENQGLVSWLCLRRWGKGVHGLMESFLSQKTAAGRHGCMNKIG